MGDCHIYHDEIRINVSDPTVTKCWVYLRGEGDCPFQVIGWHYKEFPASVLAVDILTMWQNGEENPMSWPRMDPPPTVLNYSPDWDAIEAEAMRLLKIQGSDQ